MTAWVGRTRCVSHHCCDTVVSFSCTNLILPQAVTLSAANYTWFQRCIVVFSDLILTAHALVFIMRARANKIVEQPVSYACDASKAISFTPTSLIDLPSVSLASANKPLPKTALVCHACPMTLLAFERSYVSRWISGMAEEIALQPPPLTTRQTAPWFPR